MTDTINIRRATPADRAGLAACNPVSNAFWRAMGFQPKTIGMNRPLDITDHRAE